MREHLLDECPKTFCYLDKLVLPNDTPKKIPPKIILNEIFERGNFNQNYSFVSYIKINDFLKNYEQKFYQMNNEEINKSIFDKI